jgi:tetratricopeptide (TPR) repeat protein
LLSSTRCKAPGLIEECKRFLTIPEKIFMFRQRWLTGTFLNKYLNARLCKALHGWRYKKRVHEYLAPPPKEKNLHRPNISEEVVLYQNRNDDDDKTKKRFIRDKAFLLDDIKEGDPRDMFYLAQTLSCLEEYEDSYDWYQKRGNTIEGFWEERFHSFLRSAEICLVRRHDIDMAIVNFFKAAMIDCRAEPLINLAKIYRNRQDFFLAYLFSSIATKLDFPHQNILFVSERDYSYERWQQHSVISYYVGRYSEGLKALDIAEKTGNEPEIHLKNRSMYKDKGNCTDVELFETEPPCEEIDKISSDFITIAHKALIGQEPV